MTVVTAYVHQGAVDVLGAVVSPQTAHQAKFSMGAVLGLIAIHARAGLAEFYQDPAVGEFRGKVAMHLDPEWMRKIPGVGSGSESTDPRRPHVVFDSPIGKNQGVQRSRD